MLAMIIASPAYANERWYSTTDLNLIPITDTLEEGTVQWDVTAVFDDSIAKGRTLTSRTYIGLWDNVEIGMQWGLTRPVGPVAFGGKWKILDEYDGDWPVSVAIGFDGATGNYQRTGYDPVYYGVLGIHDVRIAGWSDWYVGLAHNPTGFDDEDNSVFGGVKYWVNDRWQFNADYSGFADNEEFFASGGLNYDLVKHIELQGFIRYDSVSEDSMLVLSFNSRADLRDLTAETSDPE